MIVTNENSKFWLKHGLGLIRDKKIEVCMDPYVKYSFGMRAFLKEKRELLKKEKLTKK